MAIASRITPGALSLPCVEAGDHLDQVTYHERYKAMPLGLIVEVASSSASIDLHAKRHDYEQTGVVEYVSRRLAPARGPLVCPPSRCVPRSVRRSRWYLTSTVFPGLWLDVEALLQLNSSLVIDTLRHGLATPEHAAFVQQLQRQRQA